MSSDRSILFAASFLLAAVLNVSGCANVVSGALTSMRADAERNAEAAKQKPELTQLQIRELQTREYDSATKARILPVAIAVLQDGGYVIGNANAELGLLSASKQLHKKDVDDAGTAFMKGFFGMGMISTEEWSTIETNVTVTLFGDKVRVRMAARLSAMSTSGATQYEQITEPEFYQNFFTTMEKGLFIEREQL